MLSRLAFLHGIGPVKSVKSIGTTSKGIAASPSRRGAQEQASDSLGKVARRKRRSLLPTSPSSRFCPRPLLARPALSHSSLNLPTNNLNSTTQRTLSTRATTQPPTMAAQFVLRKSSERGYANHGWLKSYHTFSFADYYDPRFEGWGPLRVINEDRVSGGRGFGAHPHSNFEIFSYPLSGELMHQDSLKHKEVIKRGGVQHTSAGTGIAHSEFNADPEVPVHFLQVWVQPSTNGLKPSYETKYWTDEEKTNVLKRILAPNGEDGAIVLHQDASVYASILEKEHTVTHTIPEGRKGYLHLAQTGGALEVNGVAMAEGDGAFVTGPLQLNVKTTSDSPAEFLLFDLPSQ